MKELHFDMVPAWVPPPPKWSEWPMILMFQLPPPMEDSWVIALYPECVEVNNPDSEIGRLLRKNAGTMTLQYKTNN